MANWRENNDQTCGNKYCISSIQSQFVSDLAFVFGVGLTLSVVGPDPVALWMMEPLAVRITHFGHLLCGTKQLNLVFVFSF